MNKHYQQKQPDRSGFTLLELMVVMGIIIFLTTITLISLGGSGTQARVRATQVTIRKIHALLRDRKEAFNKIDMRAAARKAGIANTANADIAYEAKRQLKRIFPQRYEDDPSQTRKTSGTDAENERDEASLQAESSEFLYEMLQKQNSFKLANTRTGEFKQQEIGDTDEDGRLEFIDAWGEPLRFYRWPTRVIRPNGYRQTNGATYPIETDNLIPLIASKLTADTYGRDPDDPLDEIKRDGIEKFEHQFHTVKTWHTFLVISAGPDMELGLKEPPGVDESGTGHFGYLGQPIDDVLAAPLESVLVDNVTNLQRDQ